MRIKYIFLLLLPLLGFSQIPAYYNAIDFTKKGNDLKAQLTTLVTDTHTTNLPYTATGTTDVWDALSQTDVDPSNANNVLLFYGWDDNDVILNNDYSRNKESQCHTSSCNGLWVREHVFPRSLGTPNLEFEFAGADAHHLRAIDADRNNSRSNRKFEDGASTMSYITLAGNWYPGDEWKGDVARMVMYMYVRYPTQCLATNVGVGSTSYSNDGDMPNIFLDWNVQDPVSQYEINRNNVLNALQGNRNPFIDNPYLATIIWNGPNADNTWSDLATTSQNYLSDLVLYPTITKDKVHIKSPTNNGFKYTVYNALGQLILEGKASEIIDLTNNTKGMYFINIQMENRNKTFKIILN